VIKVRNDEGEDERRGTKSAKIAARFNERINISFKKLVPLYEKRRALQLLEGQLIGKASETQVQTRRRWCRKCQWRDKLVENLGMGQKKTVKSCW